MRASAIASLGLLALVGCTTSFDLASLPLRDAGSDARVDDLGGMDADLADVVDAAIEDRRDIVAPPDLPDAQVIACGMGGQPCCANSPMACVAGTICSEGYCVPCPGGALACSGVCVDILTSLSHCGRCSNPCPSGQTCERGECRLVCPMGLNACDGRCVNLSSNAAHCGACGSACVGAQICEGGVCRVTCPDGQTVCDGSCADTMSSPENCGGCGRRCAAANAQPGCAMGSCTVGVCQPGFGDCDGDRTNGCETRLDTTPTSCGRCGNTCRVSNGAPGCAAGACTVARCNDDFEDCDGDPANGCEIDLRRDARNCGRCGHVCPAGGGSAVCVAGDCQTTMVVCAGGTADCDGSMTNGCETNITTPQNCGRCANVCSVPNATANCVNGSCGIGACNTGFRDCDNMAANGCEVDTRSAVANCGACGNVCPARPHAAAACTNGQCGLGACDQGFADCDGNVTNGCEVDLRATVSNCGACGAACVTPNAAAACVSGRCAIGACSAGFADCDGNVTNGCETRISSDAANCGTCRNACVLPNATPVCANGACAVQSCSSNFGNCDGNATNGCEVDTRTSTLHCGACGRPCTIANGTPLCTNGACRVGSCAPNFADCDNNPMNGCETPLNTTSNCGACGSVCPGGTNCANGMCVSSCPPAQILCSGVCVDIRTSPQHCGGCNNVCAPPANAAAVCEAGRCRFVCAAGYDDCDGDPSNGCEVSLSDNREHCGRCRNACSNRPNAEATCSAGSCVLTCAGTFRDCDANPNNGCEVDTSSDPGNCGACLQRCQVRANAQPVCRASSCSYECLPGWGDCDGFAYNGCETNLLSNELRCGSCTSSCSIVGTVLGVSCRGGACVACQSPDRAITNCSGVISGQSDRCGVDLRTNVQHCRACNVACPASGTRRPHATMTGSCAGATCTLTCDAGWGNCDGAWQNGCETNITCDSRHCGGCNSDQNSEGVACVGSAVCCNRVCTTTPSPACNLSAPGCR